MSVDLYTLFCQLTRNGVIKKEAKKASYKHVCAQQNCYHLIDHWNTWVTDDGLEEQQE